mmetsp:Transcript_20286/g.42428  ORF Transcript_20286/g.42428 Transcript_20286/m.42428 type:complete len:694 (-) Transcript_20286:38-2119(-)
MGRRSRHSAKTGDQSLYKSRTENEGAKRDDSDDDPMYNEVDRYHNRKEEETYLKLDGNSDDDDESSEDDGITKNREGVFDLGVGGSSDEDDDDDDSEEEDERASKRAKQERVKAIEEELASSDDSDSDSEDDDEGQSNLLNWGDKKHSYYHGDTADLEIGQDVEDAYLEEEAGREVEKARLDAMDDADFMLDGDDGDDEEGAQEDAEPKSNKSKSKDDRMETIQSVKSAKQLSKLSKKEKLKLLKVNHPELLPLVQHFSSPIQELSETTMVAAGTLLKDGVAKGTQEAEAVGATPAGLQYLITKCMLQASKALNLSLYLLLKADLESTTNLDGGMPLVEDEDGDDIRNHPVMDRLNQLSQLTDKLQEGVEEKTPGLKDQMNSLVKAAALMSGGGLSSGDDSDNSDDDDSVRTPTSDVQENNNIASKDASEQLASDDNEDSSSESDEEQEAQDAIQRRIMTEARFAVRNQDIDQDDVMNTKTRKRRLAPTTSDYGDDTEEVSDRALAASRKLASTMNSIVQKSTTSNAKKKAVGVEEEGDDEYEKLQRGLSMMEKEFGQGSEDENDISGDEDEEGIGDSDEDDFYKSIKSKSKAKKEAKKQMYAVAPKYPRLEGVVEGERAIGRTIMKNRGLVPHKARINRNPRVKKREQYRKALISRKGAVREVRTDEGHVYGGEATGIKSGISRSRKLGKGR